MTLRFAFLSLSIVVVSGCATGVMLSKWKPDDGTAIISARLVGPPSEIQIRQMNVIASSKCGEGRYRIVEEGTNVTEGLSVGVYGGGTYEKDTYYWIVKCAGSAGDVERPGGEADDAGVVDPPPH